MRRIVALLLAVVLAFGMSTVAFAAPKVTEIASGVFVAGLGLSEGATGYQPGAVIESLSNDAAPGDKLNIYLDPAKFSGTDVNFTPAEGMSRLMLEKAGVELRTSSGNGANYIKSVELKEQEIGGKKVAYIQVEFISYLVGTETKTYDVTLTLYANKKKQQTLSLYGDFENPVQYLDKADDYVNLEDGGVAEATEVISRIEVYAGNGLSIFARMYQGKRYYAVATINPTASDLEFMNKYPEIEMMYRLRTVGLDGNGSEIKIQSSENLYVYGENGKLLGTTSDILPYSNRYYLSRSEIDISTSDIPNEGNDPEPPGNNGNDNNDGNGDDNEPDDLIDPDDGDGIGGNVGNGQDGNPDTGANGFANVAVVLCVTALAVVGSAILKRKS